MNAKISRVVARPSPSVACTLQHMPSPMPVLTPREEQIVKMIAECRSSKQVAEILKISVKTVETHRANVMRKLDLHSVSELVRYAIRHNLVEP